MHMQDDTLYCMLYKELKKVALISPVATVISEDFPEEVAVNQY